MNMMTWFTASTVILLHLRLRRQVPPGWVCNDNLSTDWKLESFCFFVFLDWVKLLPLNLGFDLIHLCYLMEMMISQWTCFVLHERLDRLEAALASTKTGSFVSLISDFLIKSVILDLLTELNYVSVHEVKIHFFVLRCLRCRTCGKDHQNPVKVRRS